LEELGHRVAAERHEAPEHDRVRQTGEGPFADGLALKDDVDQEAGRTETGTLERERVGGGCNQANARGDLRHERACEDQYQSPEDQRFHWPSRTNTEEREYRRSMTATKTRQHETRNGLFRAFLVSWPIDLSSGLSGSELCSRLF